LKGGLLEAQNPQKRLSIQKLLWDLLTFKERRSMLGIFVLILSGAVLETLSLGLLLPVLAILTNESSSLDFPFVSSKSSASKSDLVQIIVVAIFVIYLIKNVFLGVSLWIQRGILTKISARLSARMLEIYLRQPYSYHLRQNSSVLIRNTQDSATVVGGGLEPAITILSDGLIAVSLFMVLIVVEPLGTLSAITIFLCATYFFQRFTNRRLQSWGRQRQQQKGKIIKTIQQSLGAVKDIHVLGREQMFVDVHREQQIVDSNLLRRINLIQALPRLWLEIVAMGSLASLVVIMLLIGNEVSAIVPVIGLFAFSAFRVLPSINKIVNGVQTLRVTRSTIETIHQDLGLLVDEMSLVGSIQFEFSSLTTMNLNFRYEMTEQDVLNDVSITVRRGEAVGFVGQSGSGKSTLIDLMLGLLQPHSGLILINGHSIEDVKQSWQQQIGYIPQTIFLMDDSLRRNIAIGIADNEIDEVAIVEALKSAQLEDFVASLPEGLDTVVGERGVRLSGGQRQRIGIARALYHRPSVLVLDEATSSLDTETERGVMQAVQALQGDKTVIIVAHRLSTVEYCDRLYRLDAGRIVDEGTFDEVMNRSQS
jgi:ABC-type multidrug transport system fused ATPase/permease subunit